MGKMFRATRALKYTFLLLAGVVTIVLPVVVVVEGAGVIVAIIWSSLLALGSAVSLYGTLRKNWTGEFVGLPAVTTCLFFLAVVLFVTAFSLPISDPRMIARLVFGMMFLGFTFSTMARRSDVRFQKTLADHERRKNSGKPGL